MSNNKTAMQMMYDELMTHEYTIPLELIVKCGELIEVEKNNMCEFAAEYAQYEREQNKPGIKGAMVSMDAWSFFKNRREQYLP